MALSKVMKKHIESMYTGLCTILEYQSIKDSKTHITVQKEVVVNENIPCRLSHKSYPAAVQADGNMITHNIKLFLSPDVTVNPGSKLTVTQNGITREYKNSGVPAVYTTHQEIELELFEGWA